MKSNIRYGSRWLGLGTAILLVVGCSGEPTPRVSGGAQLTGAAVHREHTIFRTIPAAVDTDLAPGIVAVELTARPYKFTVGDQQVLGYAYNGQVPGPTLVAKVGDTVRVTLHNQLPDPTTIHWHGVNVPITMDGVPWKMPAVEPGDSFVYEFVVNQVGTFWYHPHFDTGKQVDMGLYGALVITDPTEPTANRDEVVVFDTWGEHGGLPAFPPLGEAWGTVMEKPTDHEVDHGVDLRQLRWTVNGSFNPEMDAVAGESVRLRFVNASNNGYLELSWPTIRQIAGDQGLLAELKLPETLVLAPGDRAEVELLMGEDPIVITTYPYTMYGGRTSGSPVELFRVVPKGQGNKPAGLPWNFSGEKPSEDPLYTDLVYVLSGSNQGGVWMINGETFPNITLAKVATGSRPVVEIRNLSTTEHPFHTHGMVFEVLSHNGVAPKVRSIEDTINIRIRESVRIRLHPEEPGEWMIHCHILPHAHGGMMTLLEVTL
ncbi:MAG: multicopper oxidase family protein [Myxococcales bacterium]|nr:multicopper oxidase family protein [Myxococcales bacterium]